MKLNVGHLPKTAQLIAGVIGLPATLALVDHFGGRTIWPAKKGAGYAEIEEMIGDKAASSLVLHFREPISVPKCAAAVRAVMHNHVRSEFDRLTRTEGHSARSAVSMLVISTGYTDRHIWRILGQADQAGQVVESRQAELF